MWILDHFLIFFTVALDFLPFLIQSPADFIKHEEMTGADNAMNLQQTDRQTSGSGLGLIRKSGFESRIIFG